MKTYFRNDIIQEKHTHISKIFKIIKGHITTRRKTKIYQANDYLFLDQIFYNPYTLDDYIALDLVTGIWIEKTELDVSYFEILSKMLQEEKNHAELLQIIDPNTRFTRYLYFEYLNHKTESFYLTYSMGEAATYLCLKKADLAFAIHQLEHQQIIAKHNKLFNILNVKKLEDRAYLPDYTY